MSTAASQLRFAVEFAMFLVMVAGAAIVMTRPDLVGAGRRSRSVLVPGFILIAVAAFLHGSLLTDARETPVVVFRCAGIVLLGLGTLGWGTDRGPRRLLWLSLVLLAAAEYLTLVEEASASDWVRGAGAVFVGLVLLMSARRSISARITVSVGAILLVVVLAVSVALSAVIARTVEEEAFRRIDTRAKAEVQEITASALNDAEISAKLAALTIQGGDRDQLATLSADPTDPGARARVRDHINALRELLPTSGPIVYANASRRLVVGLAFDQQDATEEATAVIGSQAVERVLNPKEGEQRVPSARAVEVVPNEGALAIGVYVVTDVVSRQVVGVVVASESLDSEYLGDRRLNDSQVTLAITDHDSLLGLSGTSSVLPAATVLRLADQVLGGQDKDQATTREGDSFIVARAVTADGSPNGPRRIAVIAVTAHHRGRRHPHRPVQDVVPGGAGRGPDRLRHRRHRR